ncbi:MAG TPA: ester cyclase [Chloroflexia bacterium]|jgi:predicted ester cyclase
MSVESTRETMMRYFNSEHGDTSMMADDVEFTIMDTGQQEVGPEGVMQMLNYFYHVAFEATAETKNLIIADGQAALEAYFTGKHIGEFAGIPATGRDVRVPLCVVYDLENDLIKRGRIYLSSGAMLLQLGVINPS